VRAVLIANENENETVLTLSSTTGHERRDIYTYILVGACKINVVHNLNSAVHELISTQLTAS
jgi:hypothetical protein